jgi:hypothetical protein
MRAEYQTPHQTLKPARNFADAAIGGDAWPPGHISFIKQGSVAEILNKHHIEIFIFRIHTI